MITWGYLVSHILFLLVLQSMVGRLIRVLQWCWLKDANFILVGGRYLSRVRAAVDSRYAHIVVNRSGNDLDPLEIAGQYHNVASCGVGLLVRVE